MGSWYINRLMTMSVPEIFHRIRQLSKGIIEEKFGLKFDFGPGEIGSVGNILGINVSQYGRLQHSIRLFGVDFDINELAGINWHKDFFSEESFELLFYRKISILKNPRLSAKTVWEINRLQFLTGICINYKISKNKSDLNLFVQIIKSWSEQNPFLYGVNWYSNIEVNLRLITWFLSWEILDADNLMSEDQEFREFVVCIWLPLIKKHCIYSFENPSKHSSANNHLISEYAGLFIASAKWKFSDSAKWKRYSQKGLETEIIKQHSAEGVNKEEAAEYIQFITDFFLLSYIVGEKTGSQFSDNFRQRLFKIFCYIYHLLDCRGNFPKYGDEDDGKCFLFDFDDKFNNFQSLLTSGSIIFNNPKFKTASNGFDIKNHFLFGESGRSAFESIANTDYNKSSEFYAEEGHFFFCRQEQNSEIYLHFDAAPLGFLSIAAHGHADALSIILNVDGFPVFVDSGTYTYHTEAVWRNYFIGTLAHNTVTINGKNQAVSGGPTLWIKKYKTRIIEHVSGTGKDQVIATHDGYKNDGVNHVRNIVFDRENDTFTILDTIVVEKNKKHLIEIPFHVHPDVLLSKIAENVYSVSRDDGIRKTEFQIDEKLHHTIINGQIEPRILGWYSASFLRKEPTNVIYCRTWIECTTTFKFLIKIK